MKAQQEEERKLGGICGWGGSDYFWWRGFGLTMMDMPASWK